MLCDHCGQLLPEQADKIITCTADLNGQYFRRDDIIETVIKYFGYKRLIDIDKKKRSVPLVHARYILVLFLRKKTKMTLKEITDLFKVAIKHHSTVIHALQSIDNLMFSDPKVLEDVRNINNLLNKKNADT